jgi:hypothetical protein
MIRKKTLDEYSIQYDIKEPAEDYDMWVRLLFGQVAQPQRSFVEYSVRQPSFPKRAEKIKRKNDVLANLKCSSI